MFNFMTQETEDSQRILHKQGENHSSVFWSEGGVSVGIKQGRYIILGAERHAWLVT